MGLYRKFILPHVLDWAMRNPLLEPARRRVAEQAGGRVLEVGIGGGANLPFYTPQVTELFGVDPDERALGFLERRAHGMPFPVHALPGSAESIPLEDNAVDCVVTTLTLCSVPDHDAAIQEIRRVLKPGGSYLFAEHGRAPEDRVARWQDRLTPCTRVLGGGCHLNYPMDRVIGDRGFAFQALETGYLGSPRPAMYFYQGRAQPKGAVSARG